MKRRSARCQVVQLQAPLCQSLFAPAAGGHGQPEPGVRVLGTLVDECSQPPLSNALCGTGSLCVTIFHPAKKAVPVRAGGSPGAELCRTKVHFALGEGKLAGLRPRSHGCCAPSPLRPEFWGGLVLPHRV